MKMEECYLEVIDWLSKHDSNRVIVSVKNDKELKKYQKYFQDEIANDLFLEPEIYDSIEWKVDSYLP